MPRKKIKIESKTKITKGKDGKMYPQPRRELINREKFEKLCFIHSPGKDIRHEFDDISQDTLARWCKDTYGVSFADAYERLTTHGKNEILATQFGLLKSKNEKIALEIAKWLGIQYCGQSSNPQDRAKQEESKKTIEVLLEAIKNI